MEEKGRRKNEGSMVFVEGDRKKEGRKETQVGGTERLVAGSSNQVSC